MAFNVLSTHLLALLSIHPFYSTCTECTVVPFPSDVHERSIALCPTVILLCRQ